MVQLDVQLVDRAQRKTMGHLITVAFVVAAIAAYWASAGLGWVGALFLVGMLCEGIAWFRVLRRDKSTSHRR